MKVRYSWLAQKFADPDPILVEIKKLVLSGDLTLGKPVQEFEERFAKLIGVRHAIGVANGTDALRLSLRAVGVGPGDEVITGANSFIASAGAIAELYATPVFVDMDANYTIDHRQIEEAITEKTKAILPVHYTGEPCEMDRILEIAAKHNLAVVEDACQAILAKYKGIYCGNFGAAAAFSLHPLKNLNVWGDGGMITTNDYALNHKLRLMRNHGLRTRDEVAFLGCNSRLDSLQAVVGNMMIDQTPEVTRKRREHAAKYDAAFASVEGIELPPRRDYAESCFHLYMIMADRRDGLMDYLQRNGIDAKVHYPIPMPEQNAFNGEDTYKFTNAREQTRSIITLPVDEYLTEEQQNYVIAQVLAFYAK